jgi:transcriptional regulator with XRE-family HTH domain
MNWNKRLQQARIATGISKADLAKEVQVSAPTVTDWESGEIKKIDGENLLKVCRALSVSPEWLMWGVQDSAAMEEASMIASAIMRIKDPAQRDAIMTQLRAFGVLSK